ncbi:Uma2 family endonuclease [Gloeocapsa sp. BRSZ]
MITLKLPLTDEEFMRIASENEEWRFESTKDGELVIMPPTGGNTGRRNSKITTQLELWNNSASNLGEAFDSSTMFVLPNGARHSPDAAWIRRNRWNAHTLEQQDKFPPLCPDFVIELCSPSDNIEDLQQKMQEYLENGAVLGWLIDPKTRRVEVYRIGKNKEVLENPTMLFGEDVLPGFVLDLPAIY